MSWHYQLTRHTEPKGKVWYAVHKNYYYRSDSYTVEPVSIKSEDKEDIKWMLEAMLMDIEKHGVKDYEAKLKYQEEKENDQQND